MDMQPKQEWTRAEHEAAHAQGELTLDRTTGRLLGTLGGYDYELNADDVRDGLPTIRVVACLGRVLRGSPP